MLQGITRRSLAHTPPTNPGSRLAPHRPLLMQNRIRVQVLGPDGEVKADREHVGNIMATYGLNRLCELCATGGDASNWVAKAAIGTHTVAESSTHDTLGSSVGSVAMTGASLVASDAGNRSLNYQMTFASDNPAGAATINEIGLFVSSNQTTGMIARTMLGTDNVNKGASDSINATYQIVFTTGT